MSAPTLIVEERLRAVLVYLDAIKQLALLVDEPVHVPQFETPHAPCARFRGHRYRPPLLPMLKRLSTESWELQIRVSQPLIEDPLFLNHRGERLTRFGVRYILGKYCVRARAVTPTLAAKRLHSHSMRHSTAVHLLRAGVDIVTISQWLGHVSITTTNRYATVDLETKRKAIEQARPVNDVDSAVALWRTDASVLTWLEAL